MRNHPWLRRQAVVELVVAVVAGGLAIGFGPGGNVVAAIYLGLIAAVALELAARFA
jgi:uncharacterized membrane protein YczE